MSKIRSKINFHILPMPPRFVPDIHNDGLELLGVPDDLIQESHAQGPRSNDQVICGQLCHRVYLLITVSGLDTNSFNIHWKMKHT